MKLISCFLFVFLIEIYIKQISSTEKYLRVNLRRDDQRVARSGGIIDSDFTVDEWHNQHIADMEIGKPPQHVQVQFSTAIYHSWIFSTRYDACGPQYEIVRKLHNQYNIAKSTTFSYRKEEEGDFLRIEKDWALGYKAIEELTFHGVRHKHTTLGEFLDVIKASPGLIKGKADGVISLQYDPVNGVGNMAMGLCSLLGGNATFAFYYPRKKKNSEQDSNDGELMICAEDRNKFDPNTINYVEDRYPGAWSIEVTKVLLKQNKQSEHQLIDNIDAVFDSAQELIFGPENLVQNIYDVIGAGPVPNYPDKRQIICSRRNELPSLIFEINSKQYYINSTDYTKRVLFLNGATICEILIHKAPITHWILGDTFLRAVYTIFDITNHRIGFADLIKRDANN